MTTRLQHIAALVSSGLIEIDLTTGTWGLSQAGRDHLDQLDLMRELDNRPGAPQSSSPRRQAQTEGQHGTAAPVSGRRPRDDGRAARGRSSKGTR